MVKSEEDAENPGLYAVEVKKADGSEVEVYLDPKTYEVVKTKDEAADEDEDEDSEPNRSSTTCSPTRYASRRPAPRSPWPPGPGPRASHCMSSTRGPA
ncbi:hypothetical protein ACFY4I_10555 [Streptomyces scabiei]|uniref:hypothetical protein n=1 Tax=Streptomyces scabiei TaxID=1930 RepID=UPI003699AAAF